MINAKILFMDSKHLYDFLIKVQAIAKIGLLYTKDEYAKSNYQEIERMTLEFLSNLQEINFDRNNFFKRDVYPTPNISVRTIVFNDNDEFLMVQEKDDGGYSFPGGWADLYDSPSEAALREVFEEAGAEAKLTKLVALLNRTPFDRPTAVPGYVVVFKAKFIRFVHEHDHEISNVGWFKRNELPPLSSKITAFEINKMLDAAFNDELIFD